MTPFVHARGVLARRVPPPAPHSFTGLRHFASRRFDRSRQPPCDKACQHHRPQHHRTVDSRRREVDRHEAVRVEAGRGRRRVRSADAISRLRLGPMRPHERRSAWRGFSRARRRPTAVACSVGASARSTPTSCWSRCSFARPASPATPGRANLGHRRSREKSAASRPGALATEAGPLDAPPPARVPRA